MAVINVVITRNGTNISSYVISSVREVNICTGIGIFTMTVDPTCPTITIGDTIVVNEDGTKKGTFYVSTMREAPNKGYEIECQDNSKYLQAYFIHKLNITNSQSSEYWITWILDRAGISSNFTAPDEGYTLPEDDKIGLEFGFEAVTRLCQQSGWYFYFDANGVCQIGELNGGWHNPDSTISESNYNIIKEELLSDDEMLRNRVVVWGGAGDSGQIYTELSARTPWDRRGGDDRTTVWANHFVRDYGTAFSIGKKILDEFSQTVSVKVYTIAGYTDISVGDIVMCKSKIFRGVAQVYFVKTEMSDKGFVTTIALDSRCPRIFGYFSAIFDNEYVYAGTNGDGIKRRTLSGSSWSDYSTGIVNKNIRDLKIKNGIFVCTTNGHEAYTREITDSSWTSFEPEGFFDSETQTTYLLEDLETAGCGMNEATGDIYIGYNHVSANKSWVVKTSTFLVDEYTIFQVYNPYRFYGYFDYQIVDTDFNGKKIVLSAKGPGTTGSTRGMLDQNDGEVYDEVTGWRGGGADNRHTAVGATGDTTASVIYLESLTATITAEPYVVDGHIHIFDTNGELRIIDFETGSELYQHSTTLGSNPADTVYLYKESDNKFHIIKTSSSHYSYVVDTDTLTYEGLIYDSGTYSGADSEALMVNEKVFIVVRNTTAKTFVFSEYDVTDKSNTYTDSSTIAYDNNSAYYENSPPAFDGTQVFAVCGGVIKTGGSGNWDIELNLVTFSHTLYGSTSSNTTTLINYNETANSVTLVATFAEVLGTQKGSTCYFKLGCDYATSTPSEKREIAYFVASPTFASFYNFNSLLWETGDPTNYDTTGLRYAKEAASGFWTFANGTALNGRDVAYNMAQIRFAVDPFAGVMCLKLPDLSSADFTGPLTSPVSYFAHDLDEYDNTVLLGNQESAAVEGRNPDTAALVKTYTSGVGYKYMYLHYGRYVGWNEVTGVVRVYSFTPGTFAVGDAGYVGMRNIIPPSGYLIPSGTEFAFQVMGGFDNPLQVEISKDSPIIFFGGITPTDGYPRGVREMWVSPDMASGSFLEVTENINPSKAMGFIPDARTFDALGVEDTTSGWIITNPANSYNRYTVVTQFSGINRHGDTYFRDAWDNQAPWKWLNTFSGHVWRTETTNYAGDVPYIFMSTSGHPSRFFQQDAGDIVFTEYSTGLPNSNITVLRVDDRV
jgi:hypothetical protein